MLEKSIEKELEEKVPHQKCLKHALDIVDRLIQLKQKRKRYHNASLKDRENYEIKEKEYQEAEKIYTLCKEMFYSSEEKQSKQLFKQLSIYKSHYPKLIGFLNRHLDKLLTHQKYPAIKKTNNIAENIN